MLSIMFYSFLFIIFIIILFNEFKLFNTFYLILNNVLKSLNKIALNKWTVLPTEQLIIKFFKQVTLPEWAAIVFKQSPLFQILIVLSYEQQAIWSSDSLTILLRQSKSPKGVFIHSLDSLFHTFISLNEPIIIFSSENTLILVTKFECPLNSFVHTSKFSSHILNVLSHEHDTTLSFDILSIFQMTSLCYDHKMF